MGLEELNNSARSFMDKMGYVPPQQAMGPPPPGGGQGMPPPGGEGGPPPPPPPDAQGGPPPGDMPPPPPPGAEGPPPPGAEGPPPPPPGAEGPPPPPGPGEEDLGVPVMLDMNDLRAIMEEAGGQKADRLEKKVDAIAKRMGIDLEDTEKDVEPDEAGDLPDYLKPPDETEPASPVTPEAQSAAQPEEGGGEENLGQAIEMLQG